MNARELVVDLGARSYPVLIGEGLLDAARDLIPMPTGAQRIAVITDAAVRGLHGDRVRAGLATEGVALHELTLEPGEATKTPETLSAVWSWLAAEGLHRADLVAGVGGGVVTDIAGFAAATYHRGVAAALVPTTLLGQVDAAIGGKTAVDLPEGKNLVGAFHQPVAVLADTGVLQTLPDEVFATGMAEVVKHALISRGDLAGRLARERDAIVAREPVALQAMVAEAAAIKIDVVAADETEHGKRAHLNYGHTLGHALEAAASYTGITHGHAVAIGMMFVAHLAAALGYTDRVAEHRKALESFGLPTGGANVAWDALRAHLARDKKYLGGVRFVLLEDLGAPVLVADIPEQTLRAAYEQVR